MFRIRQRFCWKNVNIGGKCWQTGAIVMAFIMLVWRRCWVIGRGLFEWQVSNAALIAYASS